MFIGTKKEKFLYYNTLLSLAKVIQGQNITVDLRNDSYICGHIDLVDGFMNISFSKAIYCDPQGNEYYFEFLFIQSRNIRYIHVPENMSILTSIKNELRESKPKGQVKKSIDTSRKAKKAFKQHMQTVASLETN